MILLKVKTNSSQVCSCAILCDYYSTIIIIATSSSAPSSVSHSVLNATAVTVSWDITGNVSGFVINITSSVSDTVTEQLTDSSVREFVVNGLLPEVDYTVAVRGYYQLLGPATTTSVRFDCTCKLLCKAGDIAVACFKLATSTCDDDMYLCFRM